MDIGFKDDIPDDFQAADGSTNIIDKHYIHPSVHKIRQNLQMLHYFYFIVVNNKGIGNITWHA